MVVSRALDQGHATVQMVLRDQLDGFESHLTAFNYYGVHLMSRQSYLNTKIVSSKMEVITPQKAQDILDNHNFDNRVLKQAVVRRYADEMRSGNWRETHQGIAINEKGNLVDGQHRLHAIIRADMPIKMLITTYKGDASPKLVPIDIQAVRTRADIAGIPKYECDVLIAIISSLYSSRTYQSPVYLASIYDAVSKHMAAVSNVASSEKTKPGKGVSAGGLRCAGVKAAVMLAHVRGINWLSQYEEILTKSDNDLNDRLIAVRDFIDNTRGTQVTSQRRRLFAAMMCMIEDGVSATSWSAIDKKLNDTVIDKKIIELREYFEKKFKKELRID